VGRWQQILARGTRDHVQAYGSSRRGSTLVLLRDLASRATIGEAKRDIAEGVMSEKNFDAVYASYIYGKESRSQVLAQGAMLVADVGMMKTGVG